MLILKIKCKISNIHAGSDHCQVNKRFSASAAKKSPLGFLSFNSVSLPSFVQCNTLTLYIISYLFKKYHPFLQKITDGVIPPSVKRFYLLNVAPDKRYLANIIGCFVKGYDGIGISVILAVCGYLILVDNVGAARSTARSARTVA